MNLVGQRIGSYVVQKELGAGGTGTVYLCQHTLIERTVAVKVLHDEQAQDPDQVARFFQEAKAAADIGHPNIVVIIDFGHLDHVEGRPPYLMMEALDGMSLDKRLRQGGLSLADISHIMRQVCSALVASHGKGIVHRDLKPPNVFLSDRSFDHLFVKVLDFGTAKLTVPALDGHKTMIGMVLGTPAYMSPEQCEGKGIIDHRSDIYSLGVMLYEMLTGTMPFEGAVGELLMHQIFHAPPPLRERNPQVPPAWEALCLRMMEKAREDRFQSVADLANALEDLDGHAAAYAAFRSQRTQSGKSGHTMVMPAGAGATSDGGVAAPMAAGNDSRVTVHGTLEEFAARARAAAPLSGSYAAPVPRMPDAAPPSGAHVAPMPSGAYPVMRLGAYAALRESYEPPSGVYDAMAPSASSTAMPRAAGYPTPPPSGMYNALPPSAAYTAERQAYAPPPSAYPTSTPSGMYSALPPSGAYAAYNAMPPSGAYPTPPPSGMDNARPPSGAYAAYNAMPPSGAYPLAAAPPEPYPYPQPPTPRPDPLPACTGLVTDPRSAGFARTLMIRPGGRWYDVVEVCATGAVAQPPTLPPDLSLFVAWLESPQPDPSLVAVAFLSLRTGWSTVLLCPRARW